MKKIIAYFRVAWLRRRWRRYYNSFLRKGSDVLSAADCATAAVLITLTCPGLDEDVLPYDRLSSPLSAPQGQKSEAGQQEQ